ncbi:MAG TPA: hypothetical protein VNE86_05620 [Nitrososphaerales archaeon]|nr:hypothetical protein [Nitrososphaerales archaeon]
MYMIEPIIQLLFAVPLVSQPLSLGILSGVWDLIGGFIPLIIGVLVIVLLVGLAIILLPAIIVAVVVWFLTGSFFYAGIAFLIVAVISLVAK